MFTSKKCYTPIVGLIILFVLLAGCSKSRTYKVQEESGRSGYGIIHMKNNLLAVNGSLDSADVYLNAQYLVIGKKVYYNLNVRYEGDDWLSIKSGPSLVVTVDGNQLKFSCPESAMDHSKNLISRKANEEANYEATLEDLQRMAYAKQVEVKIIGEKHNIEREFTQENFQRFQEFVAMKPSNIK